ncbi:MAG TPA: hypothetical protein VMS37_31295 [Verrucomicrobiae bacterium]|nr:hypothetical protein [Verrucomicrobiae bacterium]
MRLRRRASLHAVAVAVYTVANLLCLLTLVSFASTRAHDFNQHFRINEFRRWTIRHTAVESAATNEAADRALKAQARTDVQFSIEPDHDFQLASYSEPVSPVPFTRLLLRLKLGIHRTDASDPLL